MWGLHSSRTSQQPEKPSLLPVLLQDEEAEAHPEVTQFVQKSPWKAGGPKQPVHHLQVEKEGVWNRRSWPRYHLISTTGCWGVTDRITVGRGGGCHMTALSEGCWAGVWRPPCYLLPSPKHVEFSYSEATWSVCHGEGAGRTSGRHGWKGHEEGLGATAIMRQPLPVPSRWDTQQGKGALPTWACFQLPVNGASYLLLRAWSFVPHNVWTV